MYNIDIAKKEEWMNVKNSKRSIEFCVSWVQGLLEEHIVEYVNSSE